MWTFRDTKTLFRDRRRLLSFCINSAVACRCGWFVFFLLCLLSPDTNFLFFCATLILHRRSSTEGWTRFVSHRTVGPFWNPSLLVGSLKRLGSFMVWAKLSLKRRCEKVCKELVKWLLHYYLLTSLLIPLLMWWSKDDERNCVSTTQFQPLKILFKRIGICRHIETRRCI